MPEIVARWEWRWFGRRFGPAEARLANLALVMKAGFPLPAADVAKVFAALRLDPPPLHRAHAPKGIALRSLATFGPTFVLKVRQWVKQLDRRLVVEMWLFPDGSRSLEISTKSEPVGAFQVAQELKQYSRDVGIELTGNQQTETRAAMEFYKGEVQRQARQRKPRPKSPRPRTTRAS